jgi:hypothetical protein
MNPTNVVVPIKSGWASKINWTQAAGIVASLAAWLGLDISPETMLAVFGGIQAAVGVVTVILRTWFTREVTAESVAKP